MTAGGNVASVAERPTTVGRSRVQIPPFHYTPFADGVKTSKRTVLETHCNGRKTVRDDGEVVELEKRLLARRGFDSRPPTMGFVEDSY